MQLLEHLTHGLDVYRMYVKMYNLLESIHINCPSNWISGSK